MKKSLVSGSVVSALGLIFLVFASLSGYAKQNPELQAQLKQFMDEKAQVETHLVRFDSLDYDVFSDQKWELLSVSHAEDIVVHWPDGHTTTGIEKHIEDLKAMFVYAPDTKIETHPIRFGSGEWTCVTGEMTGTFSRPMPIGGGKTIPPTDKKFKLPMCTVGRWKDGRMMEEYLFWDNQTFMQQIGLAK